MEGRVFIFGAYDSSTLCGLLLWYPADDLHRSGSQREFDSIACRESDAFRNAKLACVLVGLSTSSLQSGISPATRNALSSDEAAFVFQLCHLLSECMRCCDQFLILCQLCLIMVNVRKTKRKNVVLRSFYLTSL